MAKSPFKMAGFSGFGNSPMKQVSGKEYPHHAKYNPRGIKTLAKGTTLGILGGAVMAYDVLKTGVKRVVKGIKTGKPQTKLKGDWKRAPKKKYI